jgi:hypothetical protein
MSVRLGPGTDSRPAALIGDGKADGMKVTGMAKESRPLASKERNGIAGHLPPNYFHSRMETRSAWQPVEE